MFDIILCPGHFHKKHKFRITVGGSKTISRWRHFQISTLSASLDPHSWSIADIVVGIEVNMVVEDMVDMITRIDSIAVSVFAVFLVDFDKCCRI